MSVTGQWYLEMTGTPEYEAGWDAWMKGEPLDLNKEYAWQIGWHDARYENQLRIGEP